MQSALYSIAQLNQMTQPEFVAALGAVFEDTPAIVEQAWNARPFADVDALYRAMETAMEALTSEAQLALIRAHPDLGTRAKMAEASVQEQAGVGLDRLTPEEYDRFQKLNQAYKEKFDIPFIIAVKEHTKTSILSAFEQRLQNPESYEVQQALVEIRKIAHFRLLGLVS